MQTHNKKWDNIQCMLQLTWTSGKAIDSKMSIHPKPVHVEAITSSLIIQRNSQTTYWENCTFAMIDRYPECNSMCICSRHESSWFVLLWVWVWRKGHVNWLLDRKYMRFRYTARFLNLSKFRITMPLRNVIIANVGLINPHPCYVNVTFHKESLYRKRGIGSWKRVPHKENWFWRGQWITAGYMYIISRDAQSLVCTQDKPRPVIRFSFDPTFTLEKDPYSLSKFSLNNTESCILLYMTLV